MSKLTRRESQHMVQLKKAKESIEDQIQQEKIRDDKKGEVTASDQVQIRPPTPKYHFPDKQIKRDDSIKD